MQILTTLRAESKKQNGILAVKDEKGLSLLGSIIDGLIFIPEAGVPPPPGVQVT